MKAIYNISYGVYVLTAKNEKDNGCIINTLIQVTSSPNRVSITINKDNYTTKMIQKTGLFNVSILDKDTTFDLIKHFGFSSGNNVDKFEGFTDYKIAKNGIPYITKNTNAYISAKVVSSVDVGSHIIFIADVTDDVVLSTAEPATYAYYLSNIKPKLDKPKKKVYVCRICGYIYEGDELPMDFICPICKHGAEDFEVQDFSESRVESEKINRNSDVRKKKYYCPVCGCFTEQESCPEKCMICGASMLEVNI